MPEAFLAASGLSKTFPARRGTQGRAALFPVDLSLDRGRTLGVVGESGSGKTTLGRCLLRLVEPTTGRVTIAGTDVTALRGKDLRRFRCRATMVFQDPGASLNPRLRVGTLVSEPLIIHGLCTRREAPGRAAEMLEQMGLPASAARRYPHELSGGQRQRVAIARALATRPEFLVADEPVSALDVSIQAQILNLLAEVRDGIGLTMVFISHDISVVRWIADSVAVFYRGLLVEAGPGRDVLASPLHPYTRLLRDSAPSRGKAPPAAVPEPAPPPEACCPFAPRCDRVRPDCMDGMPALVAAAPDRNVRCRFPP
jgi:oligopeptide/dipeptide ABC transporter ATP-binding protein